MNNKLFISILLLGLINTAISMQNDLNDSEQNKTLQDEERARNNMNELVKLKKILKEELTIVRQQKEKVAELNARSNDDDTKYPGLLKLEEDHNELRQRISTMQKLFSILQPTDSADSKKE